MNGFCEEVFADIITLRILILSLVIWIILHEIPGVLSEGDEGDLSSHG